MNISELIDNLHVDFIEKRKELEKLLDEGKLYDLSLKSSIKLVEIINSGQKTSLFWVHWLSKKLSWKLNPNKMFNEKDDNHDYGDIIAHPYKKGEDNIEVKTIFKSNKISVGQIRLYENIPWYLFFIPNKNITLIIHKNELLKEIKNKTVSCLSG